MNVFTLRFVLFELKTGLRLLASCWLMYRVEFIFYLVHLSMKVINLCVWYLYFFIINLCCSQDRKIIFLFLFLLKKKKKNISQSKVRHSFLWNYWSYNAGILLACKTFSLLKSSCLIGTEYLWEINVWASDEKTLILHVFCLEYILKGSGHDSSMPTQILIAKVIFFPNFIVIMTQQN